MYNKYINSTAFTEICSIEENLKKELYTIHTASSNYYSDDDLQVKKGEKNIMSISYSEILRDGIIMLTDSRSTKLVNGVVTYDDNYQKMYYSTKFKIGLASTGLNEFDNASFVTVISEIENNSEQLSDFMEKVNNQLFYYVRQSNVSVSVVYAHYIEAVNYRNNEKYCSPEVLCFTITAEEIKTNRQLITVGKNYIAGVAWCCEYFKGMTLNQNNDSQKQVIFIRDIIKQMIILNQLNNQISYIGGEVKALLLHPDGTSEWL